MAKQAGGSKQQSTYLSLYPIQVASLLSGTTQAQGRDSVLVNPFNYTQNYANYNQWAILLQPTLNPSIRL